MNEKSIVKNPSTTAVISICFIYCTKRSGKRFYFTIRFPVWQSVLYCYCTRWSGSELPWAYATFKFRHCSRKIEARNVVRVKLAAFAINRAYIGGIIVIFLDRDLAVSLGHRLAFQTLSFSRSHGTQRADYFQLWRYNHDQFISPANCRDVRRGRLRSPCDCDDWFGERIIPMILHRWRVTICRGNIGNDREQSGHPLSRRSLCRSKLRKRNWITVRCERTRNSRARFDLLDDRWWIATEWLSFCG